MFEFPKFKIGYHILFTNQNEMKVGIIAVVNAYGSIEVSEEPACDI